MKLWPVVVTFRAVVVVFAIAVIVVVVAVIMSIRQFKVFKWFKWRLCPGSLCTADPRRVSLTTIRIMRGVDDDAMEKDHDEGQHQQEQCGNSVGTPTKVGLH